MYFLFPFLKDRIFGVCVNHDCYKDVDLLRSFCPLTLIPSTKNQILRQNHDTVSRWVDWRGRVFPKMWQKEVPIAVS